MGNKALSSKARESSLANVIGSHITDISNFLAPSSFCSSPMGLGIKLYPVQQMILRLSQGEELSGRDMVQVLDVYGEKVLYNLSEQQYLSYCYNEGRINIPNWQDAKPQGYEEVELLIGRRGGKCLGFNELVPTPDRGFIPIGDLHDGSWVFGPDGKPCRVLQAHEPFLDAVYRVTFDDGSSVWATSDHKWQTRTQREYQRDRASLGSVRTTKEIMETIHFDARGRSNHAIKVSNPIELPEKELPLDPYCLGCFLGDGSSRGWTFAQTTEDAEHISQYFLEAGFEFFPYKEEHKWGLGSNFHKIIKSMGLINNKHIPEEYLWASKEQRLALLQGLMDTDGSCFKGKAEFTNRNEDLIQGVYHLAASLGLKPHIVKRTLSSTNYIRPAAQVIWKSPLPVFRLPRKLAQLPKEAVVRTGWRFIKSIELESESELVRCITVDREDGLFLFGKNFNTTHNSQLVSAITAYRLYKLLSIRDPQSYYGLVPGSPIDISIMAQDDDGAARLFLKLREDVLRSPFFTPYLKSPNNTSLAFVTESDRSKREPTPTITVYAMPCTEKKARGPSSIVLCLDEFAHFQSKKGSSSSDIYDSATPSTMQFKHPDTGLRDSQTLIVTSPLKRVGKYYEIHKLALEEGPSSTILTYRGSSAEVNPNIPKGYLRTAEKKSPLSFKCEYAGDFADSSESYVKTSILDLCLDVGRPNSTGFSYENIGMKYFWGFDLGMRKDASALAIAHWEFKNGKPCLIYDYIDRLIVGEGIYEGAEELRMEHIFSWLLQMHKSLPCFKGVTDQHGGTMLVQLLQAYGIENMELISLSDQINSQMYQAFKLLIDQNAARFPDVPKFLTEVKNLEAEVMNKYRIKVQAPLEKGSHDDMADAAALVAMIAVDWGQGEGSAEMKDLVQSPHLFGQAKAMMLGQSHLDPRFASLADIKIQQRQIALPKTIMTDQVPRSSKYSNARKRR